jgi:Fic family protein
VSGHVDKIEKRRHERPFMGLQDRADANLAVWIADQPYNSLPLLPPKTDLETNAVLKQCIPARAALGELKQAAFRIPNQAVLINILPVLEAKASSEIENIVTSTDKLFRYLGSEANADSATKEALRYSRAMFEGFQMLTEHPLNTRTAERICSTIKGVEMTVRKVPGVKLTNSANNEVVYTPPEGEDLLRSLLKNWEDFIHADTDIDPLIRLAVAHYQFEAIHPFTDGNGRTGRIVNSLFLIQQDLLTLPILYLSRYVIDNRADYYRLLQGVTEDGNWEAWVLYVIKGVEETARWTTEKISAINELERHTSNYVRNRLPKIYSHELISLIFKLPYCRIGDVIDAGIAKRQTASIYLKQLVDAGVLTETDSSKEKLFLHPKLYDVLTTENNAFETYDYMASDDD